MPYIPENARGSAAVNPINKAELTYAVSKLVHTYVERYGKSFDSMSDALVALEASKLEFYRTVFGPHEQGKYSANGGISGLDQNHDRPERGGPVPYYNDLSHQPSGPEVLKMAEEAFPQDVTGIALGPGLKDIPH